MTRSAYSGCVTEKTAEVRRLLDRYLLEIVEAFALCPWARAARLGDEIAVDVLWGTPTVAMWVDSARGLLASPRARVAMVVAPELACTPADLRAVRDAVIPRVPSAGIADFHPEAPLDATSPARLVPYLRRSPDPMLQLVPLALLETVRAAPPVLDRAQQIQILNGLAVPPRVDVADRIAAVNHERVTGDAATVAARLAEIAADRRRSYARVGINTTL